MNQFIEILISLCVIRNVLNTPFIPTLQLWTNPSCKIKNLKKKKKKKKKKVRLKTKEENFHQRMTHKR